MPPTRRKTKKRGSGWPRLIFAVFIGGGSIIWIILHSGGNDGHIDLFGTTATRLPATRIVATLTSTPSTSVSLEPDSTREPNSSETTEPVSITDEPDVTPTRTS